MTFLAEHPAGQQPTVNALLALMLLTAARLGTRSDAEGNLLRLDEQDRSRWNQEMIARGLDRLNRSAAGDALSEYHLQAGIAACHCAAPDADSTDWRQILALYDRLVELDDSPVVALNRAIAIANVSGPAAGIAALESIHDRAKLESYHLLYAVLGDFELRLGRKPAAAVAFRRALALAETTSEQAFLEKRLRDCAAEAAVVAEGHRGSRPALNSGGAARPRRLLTRSPLTRFLPRKPARKSTWQRFLLSARVRASLSR